MSKNKKKSTKKKNASPIVKLINFFKDEKVRISIGGILFIFTFLLLLSFVSFLFTWKADQSKLDIDFFKFIFNSNIVVENWMGKIGAKLSYIFIHNWFGIASFSFIYIFGIFSLYFFKFKPFSILKSIKYSIIITIWLSLTLGYLFADKYFMLGGSHGYFVSKWLNSVVGKAGTLSILLLSAFVFIIFVFKNTLNWIKNLFNKNIDDITEGDNKFDEVETKIVEENNNVDNEKINEIVLPLEENNNENDDVIEETNEIELNPSINDLDNKKTKGEINLEVEKNEEDPENEEIEQISEIPEGDYDPTLDLSNYKIPPLDILVDHKINDTEVSEEELQKNSEKIVKTLADYKIQIDKISATIGPTITLYEIVPAPGVRISKIKSLEDDIALSLAALGIRIIAPIPGKGTIGIEVPNQNPEIVSMKSVIASKKFQETKMDLPIVFGKTISNEIFMIDLAKAPHILMAGATGQGKSVGINAILSSLLYKKHPAQVKFVLVDPKKVELSVYSKIERHFLAKIPDTDKAIITNPNDVINTLNSLTKEMDDRYKLLESVTSRNIKEYNAKFIKRELNPEKGHRFLPFIVVIIDEFADLIMVAGKEVEMPIARIAQLARAVGIHLIVATQRPSTNVITGIIKANFPMRISFKVTSMVDSRTILDHPGANNLIGRGDMLVSNGSSMTRVQCAFIDTPEVEKLSEYIGSQIGYPNAFLLPEPDACAGETSQGNSASDSRERDKLFADAARVVVSTQQGSTSGIQRRLSIGYARAGRIMDQLEAAGIVGPFKGSKAREVLFHDELSLEQFLQNLDNPESTIGRQ